MTRDALISYVPATGGPRLYSEVVVVPRSRGVVRKCAELVERTVARRSVYISSLLLHAVSLSPLSLRDASPRAAPGRSEDAHAVRRAEPRVVPAVR